MLVKGLYLTKNPKELATRRLTEEIPSINKQPLGDIILTEYKNITNIAIARTQ